MKIILEGDEALEYIKSKYSLTHAPIKHSSTLPVGSYSTSTLVDLAGDLEKHVTKPTKLEEFNTPPPKKPRRTRGKSYVWTDADNAILLAAANSKATGPHSDSSFKTALARIGTRTSYPTKLSISKQLKKLNLKVENGRLMHENN